MSRTQSGVVEQEGEADLKLNTKCALCVMLYLWLMDTLHTQDSAQSCSASGTAKQSCCPER